MAVAKIYNSQTGQWEAVIVGTTGDTGIVQSATEPSNTDQLWLDTDDTAEPLAIPAGGSAGQILQKSTDGDYDTAWSNVPSHNYIINGAFDIWQRGDSFTIAGGNTNSDYTADRFFVVPSGGTGTITKETFTPGELEAIGFGEAQHYLKMNVTTGDNYYGGNFKVEDPTQLAGQTVTVSFWAKGTNPGGGAFRFNVSQILASGNSFNNEDITITSDWQRYSFTKTLSSLDGKTYDANSYIEVGFYQPDSSTDPWELNLWGVQLEAGSVATPFKRHAPSLQGELAACRRFFRKSYNQADAPGTATRAGDIKGSNYTALTTGELTATAQFDQPMRGNPTIKVYDYSGTVDQITRRNVGVSVQNIAVSEIFDVGETGFTVRSSSGNTAGLIAFQYTAEDEL